LYFWQKEADSEENTCSARTNNFLENVGRLGVGIQQQSMHRSANF